MKAPVFVEGGFFDDYGGGISQLATTPYNAVFFGGYADVTHQPHTIYISRYPTGREATINYGVDRPAVPKRHAPRRADPHVLRRHVDDGHVLRRQRRPHRARGEPRQDRNPVPVTDKTIPCPASKPPTTRTTSVRTLSPGETEQISNGETGFDVAFDRVIDQPGKPEHREHYTWHYPMLPNQILVGNSPDAPTTTGRPPVNPTTPGSTTPGSTTPTPPAHRPKRTRLGRSAHDRASTGPTPVPIPLIRAPDRGATWRDRHRAKHAAAAGRLARPAILMATLCLIAATAGSAAARTSSTEKPRARSQADAALASSHRSTRVIPSASMRALPLKAPVVAMAATPTGQGSWRVAADGGVFTSGDAHFYGSTGGQHLNQPIVGMAATPSGHGYWFVARRRRHLHVRQRALLRLDRRPAPEPADRRHDSNAQRTRLLARSRATAASSRSATRTSTARPATCASTSRSSAARRRSADTATGSSRPTAACSRSVTRGSRVRSEARTFRSRSSAWPPIGAATCS